MIKYFRQICLWVSPFAFFIVGNVQASTLIPLSLEQKVEKSQWVILGAVNEQRVYREEDDLIVTVSNVVVERAIKGDKREGEIVQVHTLGGVLGKVGMRVPGEASFRPGDQVVLFLSDYSGSSDEWIRPTAMGQGAVSVFEKDGMRKVQYKSLVEGEAGFEKPVEFSLDVFLLKLNQIHQTNQKPKNSFRIQR